MSSSDLGRSDFHLLVITSLKGGAIQGVDKPILEACAKRIGIGSDTVRTVFDDFDAGRTPMLAMINQKQRMKLLRLLISVVVARVDLATAHPELDLVSRVGGCFGLSKQRVKSMIQGASARFDPTAEPPSSRRFR